MTRAEALGSKGEEAGERGLSTAGARLAGGAGATNRRLGPWLDPLLPPKEGSQSVRLRMTSDQLGVGMAAGPMAAGGGGQGAGWPVGSKRAG